MSALPTRTPVTPASPQPAPITAPRSGRKNVMSALLNRKPVLWFLFLFNAAVAIAAVAAGSHLHVHGHTLHGSQQVTPPPAWASSRSGQAPPCSCAAPSGPDTRQGRERRARPHFPSAAGPSACLPEPGVSGVQLAVWLPKHDRICPIQGVT